jgi:hypothetical protein
LSAGSILNVRADVFAVAIINSRSLRSEGTAMYVNDLWNLTRCHISQLDEVAWNGTTLPTNADTLLAWDFKTNRIVGDLDFAFTKGDWK